MSLISDLQTIDLSGIVSAKSSISVAANDEGFRLVVDGGAAATALGGLNSTVQALRDAAQDPAALIQPLVTGVVSAATPIQQELPLGPYLAAVQEGATLIAGLVQGLDGDFSQVGANLGGDSLGGLMDRATNAMTSYSPAVLDDFVQMRQLVDIVEGEMPSDPEALARLAIDILLPVSSRALVDLRAAVSLLLQGSATISLPTERTAGLVVGLNGVASAAATGDFAQLQQALQELERIRLNTVNSLRNDMLRIQNQVGQLPLEQLFSPMNAANQALLTAEEGILEFLGKWRAEIARARQLIETIDLADMAGLIDQGLDAVEEFTRRHIVEPIEQAVERLKAWLRNLLGHLHLRELRGEVTSFLNDIAQAIHDADLGQYARSARQLLDDIEAAVSADFAGEIRGVIESAKATIDGFLDQVIGSLETITAEINAVAAQAQGILEQAADMLETFKQTMDQITQAIDQLGVEEAAQQVISVIVDLRTTAEELLSVAPLPEPMRPLIEQLIAELESIDLDVVFEPVRSVVNSFDIPDEVSTSITDGLEAVRDALNNLIPAELIASIEAEIEAALDVVRDFDPSSLLSGVSDYVEEAAGFIEQLDPRPLVDEIRGPYQAILDGLDLIHPQRLLQPVIDAYDDLLGDIDIASPESAVNQAAGAVGAAGEQVSQAVTAPIQQMAPEGALDVRQPDEPLNVDNLPQTLSVRPGDIVRMFGYLPNQLREFLAGLDESVAGEALGALNALGQGLAADLRTLPDALWGLEGELSQTFNSLLSPLGQAQANAQLAIQANFGGGDVDINLSLSLVASTGPGRLRSDLNDTWQATLATIHRLGEQLAGTVGSSLEHTAGQLENSLLAGLTGSLDSFLAALDPEPIAAELDALVEAALRKAPEALTTLESEIEAGARRLERLVRQLNPGMQAHKFLTVLEVLGEELDVLNPQRLADELAEIHRAIKVTIQAYDPALFADEIFDVVSAVAGTLRSLDPAALLGDLSFLDETIDRIENAVPTDALAGIGASLTEVGERLTALDPAAMLEEIEQLGPRILAAFELSIEAIRREIITLLEAIRFASGSASVSVSASASVG
jgi:hypothetical protein